MPAWLLPEHIADVLPEDARRLERLRRRLIDWFGCHGYQLVQPPLLEYIESLLSGTGHDLDLATFRLVDQISGRYMGIRADHTPQVARIDAHLLDRQGVTRLCYAGSVLHTVPAGLTKSREPFQVGAELYGHAGIEADLEIQQLMVDALGLAGVTATQLDIGHPSIFRALLGATGCDADRAEELFHAVQRKDAPALGNLVAGLPHGEAIIALTGLHGEAGVLEQARKSLPALPAITGALDDLEHIVAAFGTGSMALSVDLAELGGFNYESGIVFAAFVLGSPDAVARGGRYDEVGKAFGRSRPATGFTLDLKALLDLLPRESLPAGILAPASHDPALAAMIRSLREAGETVVIDLPGHAAHRAELRCDRQLVKQGGQWQVAALDPTLN